MKFSKFFLVAMLVIVSNSLLAVNTLKPPKVKVKWKHHDCSWTGGFCLDITWNPSLVELTPTEVADGYGTFDYSIKDGKLNIVFNGSEATVNGTFPVDDDITIPVQFASEVGYTTITIKKGIYSVDYSSDIARFGQVNLDCILTK